MFWSQGSLCDGELAGAETDWKPRYGIETGHGLNCLSFSAFIFYILNLKLFLTLIFFLFCFSLLSVFLRGGDEGTHVTGTKTIKVRTP